MSPIRCHALEPNISSKSTSVVGVISSCWSTLTPNNLLPGDIILALHPVAASPCPEDAAAHAAISRTADSSRIRQVPTLRRLVDMVAVGCAAGAFRGCTATLTVLRGTSKFITAVQISPSALAQGTASQITETEPCLPEFQSILRPSNRPSPCGSCIFQGVTIAEGSHQLFAPLARKTEATILRLDQLKALRHATSKAAWPRPVNLPGCHISSPGTQETQHMGRAAVAKGRGSASLKESLRMKWPTQARAEATACYGGCDLEAIQGSAAYCSGVDASFGGYFSNSEAFMEPVIGRDENEPLYRPLLVDFSRGWRQRRAGDLAASGSA